jgi:hypothetical protein
MSESSIPFWLQAVVTVAALGGIIGYVQWQVRRSGREAFSVLRVLRVASAAACIALPFVAAWWWLAPRETGRHSPLLLAATFVPIAALEAWGVALALRKRKAKKT